MRRVPMSIWCTTSRLPTGPRGSRPKWYRAVNVEGTRFLLRASQAAGVRRFVHCSTVGVHGHVAKPPANEDAPLLPGDIYQATKLEV